MSPPTPYGQVCEGLRSELHDKGVLLVTFTAPERVNALTQAMKRDLIELVTRAQMDDAADSRVFHGVLAVGSLCGRTPAPLSSGLWGRWSTERLPHTATGAYQQGSDSPVAAFCRPPGWWSRGPAEPIMATGVGGYGHGWRWRVGRLQEPINPRSIVTRAPIGDI